MTRILLASGSPRRRELFELFGWPFEIASADIDETPRRSETPAQMVERLAQAKALAVARRTANAAIVIAADTTVSLDGVPLGKPRDEADADRMLRALRGRAHQVHTAIALVNTRTGQRLADLATTEVPMRDYADEEIAAYIASGDPLDKAGAYAIQHEGFHPVTDLQGCFANVMGLPLCHLARTLRAMGSQPPVDVPGVCQSHVRYRCPVFAAILARQNDSSP